MNPPILHDVLPIVRTAGKIILHREGAGSIRTKAEQDFATSEA